MSQKFNRNVYGMNESDKGRNSYHEKMDGGCDMNKHVNCYQSVITCGDAPASLQYMDVSNHSQRLVSCQKTRNWAECFDILWWIMLFNKLPEIVDKETETFKEVAVLITHRIKVWSGLLFPLGNTIYLYVHLKKKFLISNIKYILEYFVLSLVHTSISQTTE